MLRCTVVFALSALLIGGCSSTAPIYISQQHVDPSPQLGAQTTKPPSTSLEIQVVPRIGLFDELLYECKSDYSNRIQGEEITKAKVLPPEWDAVIPHLYADNREPTPGQAQCENTHIANLKKRNVVLEVRRNGEVPEAGCTWQLNSSKWVTRATGSCRYKGVLASNDAEAFKVSIGGTEYSGEVPRDTLIVSMGDSYASGEGNPDVPMEEGENGPDLASVTWMSRRCHRSLWAGPLRAGMDLAARRIPKDGPTGVRGAYTILSTACSGAEMRDLTTTGYAGRETLHQMALIYGDAANKNLPFWRRDPQYAVQRRLLSQVDQLRDVLSGYTKGNGHPPIDTLILSIGGNDINFGALVVGLVSRRNLLEGKDIKESVATDIKQMSIDFERLSTALDDIFHNGQPSADLVLMTGYPDPTKLKEAPVSDSVKEATVTDGVKKAPVTSEATYCDCNQGDFLGLGQIEKSFLCLNSSDNRAASEKVIQPLNLTLQRVAEKLGWLFVPGIEKSLVGHAWCQNANGDAARYVRTLADSTSLQGALPGAAVLSTGAMHPSANGHEKAYRDTISAALQSMPRTEKFTLDSKSVDVGDGTTVVPPRITISWEGTLLDEEATKAACDIGTKAFCPVAYPQVWWSGFLQDNLCKGNNHNGCVLDTNAKRQTLTVNLKEIDPQARELFIKARDGKTKARLPVGSLGKLRVDAVNPKIDSCRLIYPDKARVCDESKTWVKAEGGRLELKASVGISGFKAWSCEGSLADHCGGDSTLTINQLPSGKNSLLVAGENRVGARSESMKMDVWVDADAPVFSKLTVAEYTFSPGEPRVVLSGAASVKAIYDVNDEQSKIRIGNSNPPVCRRNVHIDTGRQAIPVNKNASFTIKAVDCAWPTGNIATESVSVVRPIRAPGRQAPLGVDEWRSRLNAEPNERELLLSILSQVSPGVIYSESMTEGDWPLLAAWLNLISGRYSPDAKVAQFTCGLEERAPDRSTAFVLAKAVTACLLDPSTLPEVREKATLILQSSGLLSTSPKSVSPSKRKAA